MIKLTICKGFLILSDEAGQIYPGWIGEDPPAYDWLPEPDYIYQKCLSNGFTPERTIDVMLRIFHRQRLIRSGFLVDVPLVIGLVGGAGAGKSCGGSAIAIYDYLLAGTRLISNMDIEVTVRYKRAEKVFKSESLDKASVLNIKELSNMYQNACLFVDEVNIEFSEARRAMSNRNLIFSYMLQERRKRMLNIIHTEQNEMWGDDRLRFATDLYIKTSDSAYADGIPQPGTLGRKAYWRVFDTSGIINGKIVGENDPNFIVFEGDFHSRPFWGSYNTYQMQGLEDDSTQKSDIGIKNGAGLRQLKDKYELGRKIANQCVARGIEEIKPAKLWELLKISDKSTQSKIGRDFAGIGIPTKGIGRAKTYLFGKSSFDNIGG